MRRTPRDRDRAALRRRSLRLVHPTVQALEERQMLSVAIGDPSFEAASTQYDYGIVYGPTDSPWTFTAQSGSNGSGVARNGSIISGNNPAAPGGTQVAFLQGTGAISQSTTGWDAGSYRLTFQAARRANFGGIEDFRVLVDGNPVGSFFASDTAYQAFTTGSFTVAAGTHTLAFQGLNSTGGDNVALLDQVAVAPASAATDATASLNTGASGGATYSGGFVAVPSTVQSDGDLANYLAAHAIAAAPAFDATFTPVASSFAAWSEDNLTSGWISPGSAGQTDAALAPFLFSGFDPQSSAPQGLYYYTTTFGVAAGAAPHLLMGRRASDNQVEAIFLNGQRQAVSDGYSYASWTPLALDPGAFQTGTNTLTVVMFNEEYGAPHPTPTGLRVEGTVDLGAAATQSPPPPPPPGPATVAVSLSGQVYDDANNDGRVQPGEPGVAGVVVSLTGATTATKAAVSSTTTTGPGGSYSFAGLAPGTYIVSEVHPAGTLDGMATAGNRGGTAGIGLIGAITLSTSDGTGYSFGLDRPPTITSTAPAEVQRGNTYVYTPAATDPDGDALLYTLVAGPQGVGFNSTTGQITWATTPNTALGSQGFTVRVDDKRGGSDQRTFSVNVVDVANRPPIFTSTPVVDAYVGESYSYQATAFDPDGDALHFDPATGSPLPTGMAFSPATAGLIGWTPTKDDLGSHPVKIQVTDGRGGTAEQDYTVVVHLPKGHLPPVFISQPVTTYRAPDPDPATIILDTTIRDFKFDYVDFEGATGDVNALKLGIVGPLLGPDGNPVYAGTNVAGGVSSAAALYTFYHDAPGLNIPISYPLQLTETSPGSGVYQFSDDQFFPIDDQGFGNQGFSHNYSFTLHSHSEFTYAAGASLNFTGDDDVWVFLNGHLAVDLGGTHNAISGGVSLDSVAQSFGMVVGGTYSFDLFYNERHTDRSDFAFQTSLHLKNSLPYIYDSQAISPEGSPIKYSLDSKIPGMGIVEATGEITWDPGAVHEGPYTVTVRATDNVGATTVQTYILNVSGSQSNTAPCFKTTPANRVNQGDTYEYDAHADDPDGDPVTYTLLSHPVGMTISRLTGQLRWTPSHADLGTSPLVEIEADDGRGGEKLQQFHIDAVVLTNQDPQIDPIPDQTILPGGTFTYQVVASDADDDRLIYSLPVAPLGMVINPVTGLIIWNDATSDSIDPQDVLVAVQDGHGGAATASFGILVTADHPPVITNAAPGRAVAGVPYTFDLAATDPDGDPYQFFLVGNVPNGLHVAGGQLVWDAPIVNQAGYPLALVAVDDEGLASDPLVFKLVVDAQAGVAQPTIDSHFRTTIQLGRTYYYRVQANDPGGRPLHLSLDDTQGQPITTLRGGPISISTSSGLVTWTPTTLGTGEFDVVASNELSDPAVQHVSVEVVSQLANNSPTISTTALRPATADQVYYFALQGTDPDLDPLEWTLVDAPRGMSLDPLSGWITWKPTDDQIGDDPVTIRLRDGQGGSVEKTLSILVRGTNLPPQFRPDYPPPATQGVAYAYQVQAFDPEGGPLTYHLTAAQGYSKPNNLNIDQDSGLITWTNPNASPATLPIIIEATDDQGNSAFQSFTLTVRPSTPPVIDGRALLNRAVVGLDYQTDVTATGQNNDEVSFTLGAIHPDGLTITLGGHIDWTPTAAQFGSLPAIVAVSLVAKDQVTQATQNFTYNITVRGTDQPPSVTDPGMQSVVVNAPFSFQAQGTDPDQGDTLSWSLAPVAGAADPRGWLTIDPTSGRISKIGMDQVGSNYQVRVVATDPFGMSGSATLGITVTPDTTPPTVQVLFNPPSPVAVGDYVRFVVAATDDAGIATLGLSVNGTTLNLDADHSATYQVKVPGPITATATATDVNNLSSSGTATLQVYAASSTAPVANLVADRDPYVANAAPQTFRLGVPAVVTAPVDILGSIGSGANGTDPVSYTLEVVPAGGGSPVVIKSFDNVAYADQVLGRFDPTMLADGSYVLRLIVNDGSQTSTAEQAIQVEGNLKLGNLHLSFADLTVPVAGIPITITRSYDTLNANRPGDFGYGWTLDEGDFQLQETQQDGTLAGLDVHAAFHVGDHIVITRPGMDPEGFTFDPQPTVSGDSTFSLGTGYYTPFFRPDPGVTDKLILPSGEDTDLIYDQESGDFLSALDYGTPYNPADPTFGGNGQLTLRTKQGLEYVLDAQTGKLASVTDRNGNTLTYDDSGIYSSTGRAVTFVRDPNTHFITKIIDPRGNEIDYFYDPNTGDLIGMADRQATAYAKANHTAPAKTTFAYDPTGPAHYLQTITDPFNRVVAKAGYDGDGRLSGLTDATGQQTTTAFNTQALTESITPPSADGITASPSSTITFDEYGNPTGAVDGAGHSTSASYVAVGGSTQKTELKSQTQVVGNQTLTTSYAYNDDGTVKSSTDAANHTTYYSYDNPFGLPSTITDPMGHATQIGYDQDGNTTSTISPGGILTTTTYDPKTGQVATSTTPDGTTSYTYNQFGDVLTSTDARGTTTTYSYDDDGNQKGSSWDWIDPMTGVKTTLTTKNYFDASDRLVEAVDAQDNITDTVYDVDGRAAWTDDPHRPGTDPAKITGTETTYDAAGRVIRTEQFEGFDIAVTILGDGEAGSTFVRAGNPISVSSTIYDAQGRATWSDDSHLPGQAVDGTRTTYNPDGTVAATQRYHDVDIEIHPDSNGVPTSYLANNPSTLGNASGTTYDDAGRVLTTTDGSGDTTTYGYDQDGRQKSSTDQTTILGGTGPVTRATSSTYDKAGRLTSTTDALGRTTTYTLDADGRTIKTAYADGSTTTTAYDPTTGRKISDTDQDGQTTTYSYYGPNDPNGGIGDLESVTLPDVVNGLSSTGAMGTPKYTYTYDASGNLLTQTDPNGHTTSYTTDAFGNRTSETLPQLPDGTVPTQGWTYNNLGQLDTATDFDGHVTTYKYDDQGRVIFQREYVDATAANAGTSPVKTVSYTYDQVDSPTGRTFNTVTINDTSSFNDNGTTSTYFDAEGRVVEVDSPQGHIGYAYDPATGQKSKMFTFGTGSTQPTTEVIYGYDLNGRLSSVTADVLNGVKLDGSTAAVQPLVTNYYYDLDDDLVATHEANGTWEYRTYDLLNRLLSVEDVTANKSKVLSGFSYTLDPTGRRWTMSDDSGRTVTSFGVNSTTGVVNLTLGGDAGRLVTYTYDVDGRLITELVTNDPANSSGTRTTYAYDLAGNRVTETKYATAMPLSSAMYAYYMTISQDNYTYDADDRTVADQHIQGSAGRGQGTANQSTYTQYTYYLDGNTKSETIYAGSDTTGTQLSQTTNTWNIDGTLARVVTTGQNALTTDFAYDANGDRVYQRTGGTNGPVTKYLNDPSDAYDRALEEYSGGMRMATYVRGLDLLFEDRPNAQGSTQSFYAVDGLGSTRALISSTGQVTDTYTYDAFGNALATTTTNAGGIGTVNPYQYAGQGLDSTGLYYNRARYYDAVAGRFTSRDSFDGHLVAPVSTNHYIYANANPINSLDPSGHDPFADVNVSMGIGLTLTGFSAIATSAVYQYVFHASPIKGFLVGGQLAFGTIYAFANGGVPNLAETYINGLLSASTNVLGNVYYHYLKGEEYSTPMIAKDFLESFTSSVFSRAIGDYLSGYYDTATSHNLKSTGQRGRPQILGPVSATLITSLILNFITEMLNVQSGAKKFGPALGDALSNTITSFVQSTLVDKILDDAGAKDPATKAVLKAAFNQCLTPAIAAIKNALPNW